MAATSLTFAATVGEHFRMAEPEAAAAAEAEWQLAAGYGLLLKFVERVLSIGCQASAAAEWQHQQQQQQQAPLSMQPIGAHTHT